MSMPMLVVFDLDDTLYLERDFVLSGFAAADAWFRQTAGVEGLAQACLDQFASGERLRVFNRALEKLGLPADPGVVARLVEVYRTHRPNIRLLDDAARYLATRASGAPCAIITDGPCVTQRAKIRALGLDRTISFIICTAALGKDCGKPHPRAFECVERWAAPVRLPLVYVADNPAKDFVTPRARGWWTVQIARPRRVHRLPAPSAAHEAHARISSLDALDECLAGLSRQDDTSRQRGHAVAGM